MARSSRRAAPRRLRSLRNLELFNVVFLAAVLLWWVPRRADETIPADTWQRSVAYLPMAALLVAGGWYWHLKLRAITGDREPLRRALGPLGVIGRLAVAVLAAGTVLAIASWVTGTGNPADRVWATGLVAFGWLEYVNYFQWQLMHDTRADLRRLAHDRRLRRSMLRRDLDRWARRSRSGTQDAGANRPGGGSEASRRAARGTRTTRRTSITR